MIVYCRDRSTALPRKKSKRRAFVPKNNTPVIMPFRSPDASKYPSPMNRQWELSLLTEDEQADIILTQLMES